MVCEGDYLPKSYLIKQCKETLNKMCHITRTRGAAQGAQLSFTTELASVIQSQVIFQPKTITQLLLSYSFHHKLCMSISYCGSRLYTHCVVSENIHTPQSHRKKLTWYIINMRLISTGRISRMLISRELIN